MILKYNKTIFVEKKTITPLILISYISLLLMILPVHIHFHQISIISTLIKRA